MRFQGSFLRRTPFKKLYIQPDPGFLPQEAGIRWRIEAFVEGLREEPFYKKLLPVLLA